MEEKEFQRDCIDYQKAVLEYMRIIGSIEEFAHAEGPRSEIDEKGQMVMTVWKKYLDGVKADTEFCRMAQVTNRRKLEKMQAEIDGFHGLIDMVTYSSVKGGESQEGLYEFRSQVSSAQAQIARAKDLLEQMNQDIDAVLGKPVPKKKAEK